jgi:hypothetical protein
MSERSVQINLKINFPVILFTVVLLHALLLGMQNLSSSKKLLAEKTPNRTPLRIRNIRTVGAKDSQSKDNVYLSKNDLNSKKISKEHHAPVKNNSKSLSLKDLTAASNTSMKNVQPMTRPGTRPDLMRPKAINGIGLKGSQMRQFADGSMARPVTGDPQSASLANSNVAVNLEVPEGVSPDELNKYELMFYGFQRRTAINYINSFYKNLDKFQRANPHLNFPLTETKQVMTGRLTYDEKGNIRQIKMIRWTNIEKLQDFFLDVLKDMDTLHNPPRALWEKNGEFSIYFSFIVNG